MAGGSGSPRLYQNADFLTADFGCVTKKLCTPKIEQEFMFIFVGKAVTPGP
jgi:hypothetical protein